MAIPCTTLPLYVRRDNDSQKVDGCCSFTVSELEQALADFYKELMPFFNDYRKKVVTKECFGFSDGVEELYNQINDLHYLGLYLSLMYAERHEDNRCEDCADIKEDSEYTEFTCLKDYFACMGINIDPLLAIFGFGLPDDCGINYMCIEEANDQDCDCPIFQVDIDC